MKKHFLLNLMNLGESSFRKKIRFLLRIGGYFKTLQHQILYRLHLVLKIEIKGSNFACTFPLWPSTRIPEKIWVRRSLTITKNQDFAENPKTTSTSFNAPINLEFLQKDHIKPHYSQNLCTQKKTIKPHSCVTLMNMDILRRNIYYTPFLSDLLRSQIGNNSYYIISVRFHSSKPIV